MMAIHVCLLPKPLAWSTSRHLNKNRRPIETIGWLSFAAVFLI
jgi:hypothetical protein